MAGTAVGYDSRVRSHETGTGHPEQVARYDAVLNRLADSNLLGNTQRIPERSATDEELRLVHLQSYIDLVKMEVQADHSQLSTGDTDICTGSEPAARAAVGCALSAIDEVLSGKAANAFCVVRPPGHHAGAAYGMGFCLFNAVAVAARYAQRKHGVERVAILDWDVHHGNGTQDIFYRDGTVLFFSTHQSPWYPGTGAGNEAGLDEGAGLTINAPFGAGAGRREIGGAFDALLVPALDSFRPDLILISAGFDSRIDDPLGRFVLTDADFGDLTTRTLDLAARYCGGRVVSVLEGGYNLQGLASAAEAHVTALLGHRTNPLLHE